MNELIKQSVCVRTTAIYVSTPDIGAQISEDICVCMMKIGYGRINAVSVTTPQIRNRTCEYMKDDIDVESQ